MDDIRDIDKLYSGAKLTTTERDVLMFILHSLDNKQTPTIKQVSSGCHTSMTTVTRTARKLGFSGFREMLYGLRYDTQVPEQSLISSEELQARFSFQVSDLERFFELLAKHEPIGIYGEGYSHLISEYIARKLLGSGHLIVEQSYLESNQFVTKLRGFLSMVILVSKSGSTDTVIETAEECRNAGIPTVVFVGRRGSKLAKKADLLFVVNDDQPLDTTNTEPSSFTGCCILAFERVLSQYRKRSGETGSGR